MRVNGLVRVYSSKACRTSLVILTLIYGISELADMPDYDIDLALGGRVETSVDYPRLLSPYVPSLILLLSLDKRGIVIGMFYSDNICCGNLFDPIGIYPT